MERPSHSPQSGASRFPGLDAIRLLAAVGVIYTHAHEIALDGQNTEWLVRTFGPTNYLGAYSVFTFFVISGFLLARSLAFDADPVKFVLHRTLRIFPAFLFYLAIIALIIGPLFTTLNAQAYFSHPDFYAYLRDSLRSIGNVSLPGVFGYSGELAADLNRSLWSLSNEILSYLLLLLLWMLLRGKLLVSAVFVALSLAVTWSPLAYWYLTRIAYTLPYFAGGVAMYWVWERYGTTTKGAILAVLALVVSAFLGRQMGMYAIAGAYLIIYYGQRNNWLSVLTDKLGDTSYGVYLYGWPVEQMVKQWTGTSSPWLIFACATPISIALGYLSCHLVERPALTLRHPLDAVLKKCLSWMPPAVPAASWAARMVFLGMAYPVLVSSDPWVWVVSEVALVGISASAAYLAVNSISSRLFRAKKYEPVLR